jgi:hypothetical protein
MRSESKSTISPTAEGVTVFSGEQLLALLRRQPIPDTHSQSADALHTPNACREIRAKKSAIRGFISEPAYRRQSQVYCRRGVRVLFQCDSIACDHSSVEG